MVEAIKIIAEAEGMITPTRKRSRKEVEETITEFTKTRAAKRKAEPVDHQIMSTKSLRDRKKAEAARAAAAKPVRTPPTYAEPVPMNFISATGYVREAAFDAKTGMFYVAFAKSIWAMTSTAEAWATFEKAVADPLTDIDTHYRKAFRGRSTDMIPVRRSEVNA